MSLEMNMMCKEVRPQPGSKKRRFEGDPFENIHSFNFAAEERYIGSKGISDQTIPLRRSVILVK